VPAAVVADPWLDPAGTRLVGDPIDVVTGRVTERILCFRLIGPLFLQWDRLYDSGHNRLRRGFGFGHAHSYDHRLSFDIDGLRLEEPIGRRTGFPVLRFDGASHTIRGATLRRLSLLCYRLSKAGSPSVEFTFADPEHPARVTRLHRQKVSIIFQYDPNGRLTGLTHSTGLRIVAEEDSAERLHWLGGPWDGGDSNRPILECSYDDAGNLISMTDALKRQSKFAYDSEGRLTCRTDRRGYSFLFEYDAEGRCVRSAGEDGVMGVVLRYRTDARITEVTRSDGGQWQYHYDTSGSITQIVGPYGDVKRFIKGDGGRIAGESDPLGNGVDYEFDRSGAVVGKRFQTGRVIAVQAGAEIAGPPVHYVADRYSQFLFGALPRTLPVRRDPPAAAPGGVPQALLAAGPDRVPPSPVVPSFGTLPWYPAPPEGREFTPFGHLFRQTLPGGRQRRWTYDPNDSMHVATDADGGVTRQERRSWNQLAARIDPLGNETRYRFTTEDHIAAVEDPGGVLSEFVYDKEQRLLGVRRAGEVRETYRYDGAGNLIEKRDGAGATLLSFTPTADRLVAERRLGSGGVHSFAYDADGRYVRAAADLSEVEFAYDALGRCILDARDGLGVQHAFAPGLGPETTTVLARFVITRNQADRVLAIGLPSGGWVRIERLAEHVLRRTCSNGTTELCQFDVMGRLLASTFTSERAEPRRWTRQFRYSAEGDLLEANDSRFGVTRYRFDAAHRLVGAQRAGGDAEAYEHDAAGNLRSQPGLCGVELGPGNRLAAANGRQFSYDLRHHIAEQYGAGGGIRYHYDSRDMLVGVENPGWAWRADYDALGRRVRTVQGGAEHLFFWDTDRLAAEITGSGLLRVYVYADPTALTPLAFVDYPHQDADPGDGAARFVVSDQRGAPVLVTDATGAVLWEMRLAPYGAATRTAPGDLVLNLRFPGHYFDAATGLHYNRFRYYDPALGRYIQSDPIGLGGGLNVYAYPANPLVRVDVRGLTGGDGGNCPNETTPAPAQDAGDQEDPTAQGIPEPPPPDPALARACGPLQEPWLMRPGEGTYPDEAREARPGQPMVLDPNESDRYLYVVLADGTIAYAPQYIDENGNESVKHTDLTEGGPARVSGEIRYNPDQDEWAMDNNSGRYSAQPNPDTGQLEGTRDDSNTTAAAQLARNSGTTNDIVPVQGGPRT
jgi:RHS repeat-associated protein